MSKNYIAILTPVVVTPPPTVMNAATNKKTDKPFVEPFDMNDELDNIADLAEEEERIGMEQNKGDAFELLQEEDLTNENGDATHSTNALADTWHSQEPFDGISGLEELFIEKHRQEVPSPSKTRSGGEEVTVCGLHRRLGSQLYPKKSNSPFKTWTQVFIPDIRSSIVTNTNAYNNTVIGDWEKISNFELRWVNQKPLLAYIIIFRSTFGIGVPE